MRLKGIEVSLSDDGLEEDVAVVNHLSTLQYGVEDAVDVLAVAHLEHVRYEACVLHSATLHLCLLVVGLSVLVLLDRHQSYHVRRLRTYPLPVNLRHHLLPSPEHPAS